MCTIFTFFVPHLVESPFLILNFCMNEINFLGQTDSLYTDNSTIIVYNSSLSVYDERSCQSRIFFVRSSGRSR